MKNILILAAVLSLSGCFYQEVSGYEISLANKYCADKGGVAYIRSWGFAINNVSITCKGVEGSRSVSIYSRELINKRR